MRKIKKYAMGVACKYLLVPKQMQPSLCDIPCLRCTLEDIEILQHTSNNVFRIKTDGRYLYFRECKQHKEIHEYVNEGIHFYYTRIKPDCKTDEDFIKNNYHYNLLKEIVAVDNKEAGIELFVMDDGWF